MSAPTKPKTTVPWGKSPHGTEAGYQAHTRRGTSCPECDAAHSEYCKNLRSRKRSRAELKAPAKTGVYVEVEVIKDRDGCPLYLVEVKGYGNKRAAVFGNTRRRDEIERVAYDALRELTGKSQGHWWIKRLTMTFQEGL